MRFPLPHTLSDRGDEVVECGEGVENLPTPHTPDLDLIVLRSRGDVVTVCENTCVNVCVYACVSS